MNHASSFGPPARRAGAASAIRRVAPAAARRRPAAAPVVLRAGTAADAPALHALIAAHRAEGHLLPRDLGELTAHAARFVVASRRGRIVGCAELAPLSGTVAEVRSLVVSSAARGRGVGRQLIDALQRRARQEGFETVCAFTHDAAYFIRLGFTLVPHVWIPEKIARDCHACALFRRCGQQAVMLSLTSAAAHAGSRGGAAAHA